MVKKTKTSPQISLLERMVHVPESALDFETAELLSRKLDDAKDERHHYHGNNNRVGRALQESLAILAERSRFAEYLPQVFNGHFKDSPVAGQLSDVLCSLDDTRARAALAFYAGGIIGNVVENTPIDIVLDLNRSILHYSSAELQDLSVRIDSLSRLPEPSSHVGFAWWDAHAVDAVLKLSNEPLREYNAMLRNLQEAKVRNSDSYRCIFEVLKPDEISHDYLKEFFSRIRTIINTPGFAGSYHESNSSQVLTQAMKTGKVERMDYVVDLVQALSNSPVTRVEYSSAASTYMGLVSNFICKEDDAIVKDFYESTMRLINVNADRFVSKLSSLLENHDGRGWQSGPKEEFTEAELVERTRRAFSGVISLFENKMPDEVFVAYDAKGGESLGFDKFCEMTQIPEVVDAFDALRSHNVHEYARQVMANALTHGDIDFARDYAIMISKLVDVNGLPSLYKRLDTEERYLHGRFENQVDRFKKAVKVMGSDQVIDVLSHYNRKTLRPVVGVLVNALWHNPDMADSWCKTLMELKDDIYAVQGDHRPKIKEYFGVKKGWRATDRERFHSATSGYFDMCRNLKTWLRDYKPEPVSTNLVK